VKKVFAAQGRKEIGPGKGPAKFALEKERLIPQSAGNGRRQVQNITGSTTRGNQVEGRRSQPQTFFRPLHPYGRARGPGMADAIGMAGTLHGRYYPYRVRSSCSRLLRPGNSPRRGLMGNFRVVHVNDARFYRPRAKRGTGHIRPVENILAALRAGSPTWARVRHPANAVETVECWGQKALTKPKDSSQAFWHSNAAKTCASFSKELLTVNRCRRGAYGNRRRGRGQS